jgi:C1A family cysteine protease
MIYTFIQTSITMRFIAILFFLVPYTFSASIDLDPEDDLDEDAFEEYFHLDQVTDPEEHEKRDEALKENEALINGTNQMFMNGQITWWDQVNEFANLPEDEFELEKTGAVDGSMYARGLIEPTEEERVDERSERYFDQFRYSRASVPSSYSSVALGLVSPVKTQIKCGSCVAFSNMALVETCFKKTTGVFGDYSEQQFVDCGYGKYGANGCNGAPSFSYVKWAATSKESLAHESTYPYLTQN